MWGTFREKLPHTPQKHSKKESRKDSKNLFADLYVAFLF